VRRRHCDPLAGGHGGFTLPNSWATGLNVASCTHCSSELPLDYSEPDWPSADRLIFRNAELRRPIMLEK
jgi:hypothetical protein